GPIVLVWAGLRSRRGDTHASVFAKIRHRYAGGGLDRRGDSFNDGIGECALGRRRRLPRRRFPCRGMGWRLPGRRLQGRSLGRRLARRWLAWRWLAWRWL